MNKQKLNEMYLRYRPILVKLNQGLLYCGLFLIAVGLGASYQAQHDVSALNNSLHGIATTTGILSDGTTYYFIGLYEDKINFSSMDLINATQCEIYNIGK
jgi:hypothetical protein